MCVCVCACVCVCVCARARAPACVCVIISFMVWVTFPYVDTVFGFYGHSFLCLVGCFCMIILTPAVLSVLNARVLHFCICTCSAQLNMFHMERRSRNTLIIIFIIIVLFVVSVGGFCCFTVKLCIASSSVLIASICLSKFSFLSASVSRSVSQNVC